MLEARSVVVSDVLPVVTRALDAKVGEKLFVWFGECHDNHIELSDHIGTIVKNVEYWWKVQDGHSSGACETEAEAIAAIWDAVSRNPREIAY